jgi:hypothetical protein
MSLAGIFRRKTFFSTLSSVTVFAATFPSFVVTRTVAVSAATSLQNKITANETAIKLTVLIISRPISPTRRPA